MKWIVPVWRYKDVVEKQKDLARKNERLSKDRDWYRDVCKILEDEWYRVNESRKKSKDDVTNLTKRVIELEKQLAEAIKQRDEFAQMYDDLKKKYVRDTSNKK